MEIDETDIRKVKKQNPQLISWAACSWSTIERQAGKTFGAIMKNVDASLHESVAKTKSVIGDTAGGVLKNVIKGDLDAAGDLIDGFGDKLENTLEGVGDGLKGNISKSLTTGIENIASDIIVDPLKD